MLPRIEELLVPAGKRGADPIAPSLNFEVTRNAIEPVKSRNTPVR